MKNSQKIKVESQKTEVESQKQFDFSEVGKQTPYCTPVGFFAEQEQALKQAISSQPSAISSQPSAIRPLHRTWLYAAAACALLLIAVYPVMQLVHSSYLSDTAPVYSQTSSASDDWSDFADADVFLDNMNW